MKKEDLSKLLVEVNGEKRKLTQRGEWYTLCVGELEIVVAGRIWCILSLESFWPKPMVDWRESTSQLEALKEAAAYTNNYWDFNIKLEWEK